MWRLILPDCRACAVRKAFSWREQLCHPCKAEAEELEELWRLEDASSDD